MKWLKPLVREHLVYEKASIHSKNEKRQAAPSINIDKDTCENYVKKTFPFRLAPMLKSLGEKVATSSRIEIKTKFLKDIANKQGNQRRLKDLYKHTAKAMTDDNPQDGPPITSVKIGQMIDRHAIDYYAMWISFVKENIDNALDTYLETTSEERITVRLNDGASMSESIKVLSYPLRNIVRNDLTGVELRTMNDTMELWRELISDKLLDLSATLELDIQQKTTGPIVNRDSILPKWAQIQSLQSPMTLAPPSYELKKKMTNRKSVEGQDLSNLYTATHLCQLLSSTVSGSSIKDAMKEIELTPSPPGSTSLMKSYVNQFATNLQVIYQGTPTDYLLEKAILIILRYQLSPSKQQKKLDGKMKRQKAKRAEPTEYSKVKKTTSVYNLQCRYHRDLKRIQRIQRHQITRNIPGLAMKKVKLGLLERDIFTMKQSATTAPVPLAPVTPITGPKKPTMSQLTLDSQPIDMECTNVEEPTEKRMGQLCKWLVRTIKAKEITDETTIKYLQDSEEAMELNENESSVALLINAFFSPFVLPSVNSHHVDCHPLFNYTLATLCNASLYVTNNTKFTRSTLTTKKPTTLAAIELTPTSIYNMFCLLKGREGGQKLKEGDTPALHPVGFDVPVGGGGSVTSEAVAGQHPKPVIGGFFNLPFIERLCGQQKGVFDHRLIVTTFGMVRIQYKQIKKTVTPIPSQAAEVGPSNPKKRKNTASAQPQSKSKREKLTKNTPTFKEIMAEHSNQIVKMDEEMKGPKKKLKEVEDDIRCLQNTIDCMPRGHLKKQQSISDRQRLKKQRDSLITQIIEIRNNINRIKTKKMETYDQFFGDGAEITIDYQPSSKNVPTDVGEKTTIYVGCDPGLITMLQATYADKKKIAFIINQTNRYAPLEDLVEPSEQTIKSLIKLKTFPISSHDVDRKTMSHKYRMQLNLKKDGNKGVQEGEKKLTGFINYSKSNHSMIANHRAQKKVAKELRKLYTEKWHQRNIRNSKAMKQRGLHMIMKQQQGEMAKNYSDKNLEFVYYYGHAGRVTNSRIK